MLNLIAVRHARRVSRPTLRAGRSSRGIHDSHFVPLLDAKAAGALLGVPPTWLLAQARSGRIPHHRLGHYVRFSTEDLHKWLAANRIMPGPGVGMR